MVERASAQARLNGCLVSAGVDNNADNNMACARRSRTASRHDNDEISVGELHGFRSSHRRGHWFDPSIAHHARRPLTCEVRGLRSV
jgi:hypothetical protein